VLAVVSDTSPLRCLAHVGQLSLLEKIFSAVVIPPAVRDELRRPERGDISDAVLRLACVRVQPPTDLDAVARLRTKLDAGESEAIALASELRADLVLMDEKRGRAECSRRDSKRWVLSACSPEPNRAA
jgi:predicted nucleic acid-binding protein